MKKLKLKGSLGKFIKSETVKGQGIAALIKFPLSMVMTDLGAKILFTAAGAIGGIANEALNKKQKSKNMLRHTAANMMYTFADPTPNQMRAIKSQGRDLWSAIRYGNFNTLGGSLFEEASTIKAALPKLKMGNFKSLKGKFGSAGFRLKKLRRAEVTKDLTPASVTSYGMESDDIISY